MNGLVDSPSSVSTRCSSCLVPSVAATSACVSPRVKSAEPWVRGRNDTSALIARVSVDFRPSIADAVLQDHAPNFLLLELVEVLADLRLPEPVGIDRRPATSWASFVRPWARSAFSGIRMISRIRPRVASRTWASSVGILMGGRVELPPGLAGQLGQRPLGADERPALVVGRGRWPPRRCPRTPRGLPPRPSSPSPRSRPPRGRACSARGPRRRGFTTRRPSI